MRFIKKTIQTLTLLAVAVLMSTQNVYAMQEVKLFYPEPYSSGSNVAEGQVMGMYYGALDFNMQNHPNLRGKYKMRWVGDIVKSGEESINAVATGAGHITYTLAQFIEQFDPNWSMITAPGMFKDFDHFLRAMDTPEWKERIAFLEQEKGFKILKWTNTIGFFWLWTSTGPADSVEAVKNMKIRYSGQQSYANALKALGVVGVALPYTEVPSALQTNMIDGVTSDIFAYEYYGLPRMAKFLVPIPLGLGPQALIVNAKWWNELPEKDRETIEFVINCVDVKDYYTNLELDIVKWWDENPDLTLVKMTPEAIAEWEGILKSSTDEFLKDKDTLIKSPKNFLHTLLLSVI